MTHYDQETKDRVVRMFAERRDEVPKESRAATYRRLRDLTGIPVDTMRGWVDRARVDAGDKPGVTTAERCVCPGPGSGDEGSRSSRPRCSSASGLPKRMTVRFLGIGRET